MNFKEKYQEEMSAVKLSENFCEDTVRLMQQTAHRKENVSVRRKSVKIILVTAIILATLSMSAFAITQYLSAKEVAQRVGENKIAALFENSNFIPETISNEAYSITLHGIVSGDKLENFDSEEVEESRSYAVLSVARTDGTPLNAIDGSPIQMAPVVDGYNPWTIWTLGMSAVGLEHEGVLYFLFDYTNLEIFADQTVSIAVFEGAFPTAEILTMDENGKIIYADGYVGFKGIFELQMDKSKADPEKVKSLLENF